MREEEVWRVAERHSWREERRARRANGVGGLGGSVAAALGAKDAVVVL